MNKKNRVKYKIKNILILKAQASGSPIMLIIWVVD
jgi:hypothetical protein